MTGLGFGLAAMLGWASTLSASLEGDADESRIEFAAFERVPVSDDWFEVHVVAPGVLAILEPFQRQEVISFLILGTKRALLFDTGLGISSIGDLVRELTAHEVTVLNSHTHFDHIGGNAEFDQILAMDTDYTKASSQGIPNSDICDEVSPMALRGPLPDGFDPSTYSIAPFEITQFITDGYRIDLGDRILEVVAVPGHTPDSIALLDADAGSLWTGDTFYEGPIWLFVPETDLKAYAESLERLVGLVPRLSTLFPAHDTPTADPSRLEELRDALALVQAGGASGTSAEDGRIEYDFGAFSLLMQGPDRS